MSDYTPIDLAERTPLERYKLLTGSVVPRPIAFVTTLNEAGGVNLAPFSQFIIIAANPGLLGFSCSTRDGARKDTVNNVLRTGEMVINITTPPQAHKVQACAADFSPDESEVEAVGINTTPSVKVAPPRVVDSPVHFECSLEQTIELGDLPNTLVVGRVVLMHVRSDILFENSKIDPAALDPLGRIAGRNFCTIGDIISV